MKQIIKSILNYIPDKLFLRLKFRRVTGRFLNINHPRTFMEKIQWLKIHDRREIYTTMVDKVTAKQFASGRIGRKYIIPTLAVWDKVEDIDVTDLPNQFVIKTTHGGGNNGVYICRDKSNFDLKEAKKRLSGSLAFDIYNEFREWPYKNVIPKIIVEEFIKNDGSIDLIDYKIYCFDGHPKYIQVIKDRNTVETIDFFDIDWVHQPFYGLNPKTKQSPTLISRPKNLEKMIEIAAKLSAGIPFLRVDLYNLDGTIYFGEMTFYPASGMGTFTPSVWDLKLGELIKLPNKQ